MSEIAIKIQDLTKIYKTDSVKAVDSLDLEINKGEIFGLLGPNGAGKTTLIRVIVGLLKSSSGHILFDGEELNINSAKWKHHIGYVPQETAFWKNLTVYENLNLIGTTYNIPNKELKERINHLLEGLYLVDHKKKLASKLSGGMQRRLNLAMGMVHDPQILLLDEVFVGLDPQTRNYLYNYLRDFASKENKTIIITSHLMEIVDALSDRVGILDLGKMLAVDTPDNLKNTHGKGDILELEIDKDFNEDLVTKVEKSEKDLVVEKKDQYIIVKTLNAISKIPEILNSIEEEGFTVLDVKITKQSLETVFISLTGKELRGD
ncbi:MAG: ABC transporter ATP-binding protein [Candidatus Heimdallarchaeaceae archaeon]